MSENDGPLQVGARVHLQQVARDGDPRAFVARVTRVDDDGIEVDLLDPAEPDDLLPGAEVRLTLGREDGLYLANTRVDSHDDGHLVFEPPTTTRTVQRRRHRRTSVALELECRRLADSERSRFEVTTVDLSEGGVRIVAPTGLVVGDVVMLTLAEETDAVAYRGLVVDVRGADRDGAEDVRVKFAGFNAAMEAAVRTLLARHTEVGSGT